MNFEDMMKQLGAAQEALANSISQEADARLHTAIEAATSASAKVTEALIRE